MKLDASVVRRGFALLAYSIRTAPRPFAVATAGAALFAAMIVASAKVFEAVTDRVIVPAFEQGSTTTATLAGAAAAIVGVAVVKALGIVFRRVGASYMQYALQAHVRREVTERYQQLPLAWHQRRPVGELLSRAHADVEAMFWLIAPLPLSIGVVVLLVIATGVLLATDVVLTLVALLLVPAVGLLTWRYNRLTVPPATRSQQLRADVAAAAHESFDGALVVKTLGREAAETDRFRARSDQLRDVLVHLGRLKAGFDPVVEGVPQAVILLVLLVGALRAAGGAVTAGDVVGVSFLLTLLAFPIRIFGYLFSEMPRSVVGWQRVREVLEAEDSLPAGERELPRSDQPARLDAAGVRFAYAEGGPDEAVVRDVGLTLDRGRTVALVGPTGSGKSTVAALLVRLVDPQAGAIRLDAVDLRDLRAGVITEHAALVLQETFLFADTVRENITLGGDHTDGEVREAAQLAQAAGFIERLPQGYDTPIGERGATLSGGQRQRLALARALVRRPRLLILDDATSSVDPRVEGRILAGLGRAALPATVVIVASRVATIELADEVVFLDRGEVRARGTHDELLDREPGYRHLIEAFATADDVPSDRSA